MAVDIQNHTKSQEEKKRRYKKKGLFLIPAVILWLCFFILLPTYGKLFWVHVSDYMTINLKTLYSPIMTLLHTSYVLTFYGLFSICYSLKSPTLDKWRANPNAQWPWEKDPQEWAVLKKKTYKTLAFHHFIVFPIVLLIDSHLIGLKYQTTIEQFPTILEFGFQIYVCTLAEDFGFFWSHYTLHHPKIYTKFHKKHHEYNNTYSIVAEYTNTFEYIFGNIIPSILGIKILLAFGYKVHIFTAFGWLLWRIYTTAEAHSGYEVPFSPLRILPLSGSTYFHDFHHEFNSGAYGSSFMFWDHLMKTDRDFVKYRYDLNNKTLKENQQSKDGQLADQNKSIELKLKQNIQNEQYTIQNNKKLQ